MLCGIVSIRHSGHLNGRLDAAVAPCDDVYREVVTFPAWSLRVAGNALDSVLYRVRAKLKR